MQREAVMFALTLGCLAAICIPGPAQATVHHDTHLVTVHYDPLTQTITLTPDVLEAHKGVHTIVWAKSDAQAPFQLQLVEFKDADAPFSDFGQTPVTIACVDDNMSSQAHGEWAYKICIRDTATSQTHCLDPTVRNKSNGD